MWKLRWVRKGTQGHLCTSWQTFVECVENALHKYQRPCDVSLETGLMVVQPQVEKVSKFSWNELSHFC